MHEDVFIAGFGGQGILLIGQLLAYAGMEEGKHVLWIPVYGPETRGGFAYCTVVLSDEEIGSPVVVHPNSMIIMNLPSMDKFEPNLLPGGLIVVNSSMVNRTVKRRDVTAIMVPATEIATELGNQKMANMVVLGAYLAQRKPVSFDSLFLALGKVFKGKEKLIPLNRKALERGAELAAVTR
ncbi:MAG: 2-oxoacid:acceptor oxidoreductase family protein [bacterium]